ncbi:hypothetical protein FOL46_000418 [Perkinsus olseni]|uniref:Uncharacterized protein n=1 Tax=Perkinsus olseni TaxID=32597 RepID=A0A7J6KWJ2_PEROL|nr:hypothetical protein FOL46_000418 [Perkinsus olseni]
MKKLLIIIPVNSASAAVAQNQFPPPLLPGYYETLGTAPEIPSMAGMSMRVRRMMRGKRADLKFQLDDGTDLCLDDYIVERMRYRKADEESRRELAAKCYVFRRTNRDALDDADSLSLWEITRTFTSLRVYGRKDFLICPDGGGKSVSIKLRLQNGRFADVGLMLTNSVHEGPLAITPGRYVKVEGPNYDYKELINMEIEETLWTANCELLVVSGSFQRIPPDIKANEISGSFG